MTYKVPEDYDYSTGGFLKKDEDGKVLPGQLTPNTLNHLLFKVPLSEDNPNKSVLERKTFYTKFKRK